MNIHSGQKSGLTSLIKSLKSSILLLVIVFSTWVFVGDSYSKSFKYTKKRSKDTSQNIEKHIESVTPSETVDVAKVVDGDSSKEHQGVDNSNEIVGIAKVIDGDSIMLSKKYEVRLINIDAPEYKQKCFDGNNNEYSCGMSSLNFLKKLIHGKKVSCKYDRKDFYDRYLGNCSINNQNINQELIKNGMAIIYSFSNVEDSLQKLEDEARSNKLGVWQGTFLEPRKYRKKYRN